MRFGGGAALLPKTDWPMNAPPFFEPVLAFVAGRLPLPALQAQLCSHPGLNQALRAAPPIAPYSSLRQDLFDCLLQLHGRRLDSRVNAQHALCQWPLEAGVPLALVKQVPSPNRHDKAVNHHFVHEAAGQMRVVTQTA